MQLALARVLLETSNVLRLTLLVDLVYEVLTFIRSSCFPKKSRHFEYVILRLINT